MQTNQRRKQTEERIPIMKSSANIWKKKSFRTNNLGDGTLRNANWNYSINLSFLQTKFGIFKECWGPSSDRACSTNIRVCYVMLMGYIGMHEEKTVTSNLVVCQVPNFSKTVELIWFCFKNTQTRSPCQFLLATPLKAPPGKYLVLTDQWSSITRNTNFNSKEVWRGSHFL